MLRGGTGAQGARGGLGAIDGSTPPTYGWEAYRRRDPGGALVVEGPDPLDPASTAATPLYPWGMGHVGAAAGTTILFPTGHTMTNYHGGSLANAMFAIPQPLPPGRLVRLVYACIGNAPVADALIQMGVYRALGGNGSTNLYPGDLVYDSGAIPFLGLGPKSAGAVDGGVTLPGAGLYYGVITCDAGAVAAGAGGTAVPCSLIYPVMGLTVRFGNGEPTYNSSLCVGWRVARAFGGALPSTFPTGARRLIVDASHPVVPLIYYGFDPD